MQEALLTKAIEQLDLALAIAKENSAEELLIEAAKIADAERNETFQLKSLETFKQPPDKPATA